MWKDFSVGFIRKNKASSISIMVAAFISTLFLSLLCSLFYNFWIYELEKITIEEGDWQGRITISTEGDGSANLAAALQVIENFANVENAEVNEALSDGQDIVIDVSFQNMRTIYQDMPLIARKLGIRDDAVSYHELLLSRYLIHDPQDAEPPLLMAFYLAILLIVSVSLILIIHNSFAVTMNARIHQFGILSGIGATPGQIRICLLQEAAVLCMIPVLLGSLMGIALSLGAIRLINIFAAGMSGRHEAVFTYHPLLFAVTILAAALTVFISAWLPAVRLSKLTPLAAIRNNGELQFRQKRRRKGSRMLSAMFGVEGELAGNALKAQRKALRTSTLSLTLSFLGFTLMLCFFTLSGISTNHTYFERYQDAWDVMVTLKNTGIEEAAFGEEISKLEGIADSIIYQRASALCTIPEINISGELKELGGLEAVAGSAVSAAGGFYDIGAAIVIMDDGSFAKYCKQTGIEPDTAGAIVLNRIWDSINSNFRYKEYIPYLSEEQNTITLQNVSRTENAVTLPILGFTQDAPLLREEYDNYAMVLFLSLSVWEQMEGSIGNTQADTCIRVLAKEGAALSDLQLLEEELSDMIGGADSLEIENRIQEKMDNDNTMKGSMLILGAFCALLAVIGIANVFSNTMGFIQQRKREFARYLSVGMTPAGMRKLFCVEALVIAGRPLLITLPVTALSVGFMISASYLNPMEFLAEAPFLPILVFLLAIFGCVALAYYIGGRRLMRCSLAEALRSDNLL